MTPESGPSPEGNPLRERLLDQWAPRPSAYLHYKKEVETMLAEQEKRLNREKTFTTALWIYVVLLATVLLTGSGVMMVHKVEGTWMAVSAVFWLLFGAVFLFGHLINKSRFEVIKEIKGLELRLAAMEERLAGRGQAG